MTNSTQHFNVELFPQSKDFADNSKRTVGGKDHPLVIVEENASNTMSQKECNKKYKSYEERYCFDLETEWKLKDNRNIKQSPHTNMTADFCCYHGFAPIPLELHPRTIICTHRLKFYQYMISFPEGVPRNDGMECGRGSALPFSLPEVFPPAHGQSVAPALSWSGFSSGSYRYPTGRHPLHP